MSGPSGTGRRRLSASERVYLQRRLERLESTAAELEQHAVLAHDRDTEAFLVRAEKHRTRASRIRDYLRE